MTKTKQNADLDHAADNGRPTFGEDGTVGPKLAGDLDLPELPDTSATRLQEGSAALRNSATSLPAVDALLARG